MAELLQADVETLHKLGATLSGHADAIEQIELSAKVTMPDSPVQTSADKIAAAVLAAYRLIGGNIRVLSDNTTNAAKSYEEVDRAFAGQLRRYTHGQ